MILSFLIIHSQINHEALLPCPLSLLFFIHLLPFPFPSFPSCLTALLILLPDDSRFALVTAPPTLPAPPFFPPERYYTGAAPSVPVCLSQDAVVHSGVSQGDLGQDQGAGLSV